jgi:hypothetical protein
MNVDVPDNLTLKNVEPNQLAAYLKATGWYEARPYLENAMIWLLGNGSDSEYEILLPLHQSLGDYTARIREALSILELVEKRDRRSILLDLLPRMNDTIVIGIVTNIQEGIAAGKVTLMGVVIDRLRRIQLELAEPFYELAVKAYQARIPVQCQGDLVKQGRSFVLQNPHHFTLDLEAWMES